MCSTFHANMQHCPFSLLSIWIHKWHKQTKHVSLGCVKYITVLCKQLTVQPFQCYRIRCVGFSTLAVVAVQMYNMNSKTCNHGSRDGNWTMPFCDSCSNAVLHWDVAISITIQRARTVNIYMIVVMRRLVFVDRLLCNIMVTHGQQTMRACQSWQGRRTEMLRNAS